MAALRPQVLTLGYSYLSSTPLTAAAQPCLNAVGKALGMVDEFLPVLRQGGQELALLLP